MLALLPLALLLAMLPQGATAADVPARTASLAWDALPPQGEALAGGSAGTGGDGSAAGLVEGLPPLPPGGLVAVARVGTRVFALLGDGRLLGLERARFASVWEDVPDAPRLATPAVGTLCAASQGDGHDLLLLLATSLQGAAADAPSAAYAFAPDAGTWRRLADLPLRRAGGVSVAIGNADVLLLPTPDDARGPGDATRPQAVRAPSADVVLAYHPVTDTWREVGRTPFGDARAATLLADGRLLVLGADGARHTARVLRPQRHLQSLDAAVIAAYLGVLVVIGVWLARRTRALDDYLLAGRAVPWWAAGLSIHGTQISAITFLATPALAYATDLRYLPTWAAILFMAPVVVTLYLPFFRQLDARTAYAYLERRFSSAVRVFASAAFMLFQLARLAIVLYLPALALAAVTGIATWQAIVLMGGLATLYTVLGGMRAVVWTDVLQVVVLFGGVGLALSLALDDVGGLSGAWEAARGSGKLTLWDGAFRWTDVGSWSLMIGAFFLQFGPYTTDQAVVQRYLAAADERSAARAIWLNGWMSVPAALLFPTLGAVLWIWFRGHPDALPLGMAQDEVFPVFMAERLPPGVAGLVVSGLLAAVMSTVDSSMHSIATAFVEDVHRKLRPHLEDGERLRLARHVTVLVGVVGTGAALILARWDVRSLFLAFQTAVGLLSSGVAGAFLLGLLTRRAHARGVLIGMAAATGLLVWVTWFTAIHTFWYGFLGIAACVVVGGLASVVLTGPAAPAGTTWAEVRTARRRAARVG